jgi:agmatinase
MFIPDSSIHIGNRGPLFHSDDLEDDRKLGFRNLRTDEVVRDIDGTIAAIRERVRGAPVFVSIDVDVLDPAFAPGTGTPEAGGLATRELLKLLRGLAGLPVVGADVVEVCPAYDQADVTGVAAATVVYQLIVLMAVATQCQSDGRSSDPALVPKALGHSRLRGVTS